MVHSHSISEIKVRQSNNSTISFQCIMLHPSFHSRISSKTYTRSHSLVVQPSSRRTNPSSTSSPRTSTSTSHLSTTRCRTTKRPTRLSQTWPRQLSPRSSPTWTSKTPMAQSRSKIEHNSTRLKIWYLRIWRSRKRGMRMVSTRTSQNSWLSSYFHAGRRMELTCSARIRRTGRMRSKSERRWTKTASKISSAASSISGSQCSKTTCSQKKSLISASTENRIILLKSRVARTTSSSHLKNVSDLLFLIEISFFSSPHPIHEKHRQIAIEKL